MTEPAATSSAERRRELERLAWGAAVDPVERDAARAELAALAERPNRDRPGSAPVIVHPDDPRPPAASERGVDTPAGRARGTEPGFGDLGDPAVPPAAPALGRRRALGWFLLAAVVVVVVGALALWRLDHRGPSPAADDIRGTAEPVPDDVPPPDASVDLAALDVFTRAQISADLPADKPLDIEAGSFRLLRADDDGLALYAGKAGPSYQGSDGGPCLLLRDPTGAFTYSCTGSAADFAAQNGILMVIDFDTYMDTVTARWTADGTVTLERG